MPIQLDQVKAIDTHVHVEADDHGHLSLDDELLDASAAYFNAASADRNRTPTIDEIAEHYRAQQIAAVVFTVDAHTRSATRRCRVRTSSSPRESTTTS